ncbi:hypothetical protein TBK1r_08070 [Stieleria magnilauensis]|uniref:Uncharacterized protein n=1 Tax=Stieleria magnilauensis TaxID=2527963 RepID=A0ABX5XIT6_9BACT|nr:hypothetical protein TBK1r_08070 [Planctomycetes bacterium TBK1r]
MFRELFGNLNRKRFVQSALDIDCGKFNKLRIAIGGKFVSLTGKVGVFRVSLRTNGNIFTCGHRHGTSDQTSNASDHDVVVCRVSRSNANNQAGR